MGVARGLRHCWRHVTLFRSAIVSRCGRAGVKSKQGARGGAVACHGAGHVAAAAAAHWDLILKFSCSEQCARGGRRVAVDVADKALVNVQTESIAVVRHAFGQGSAASWRSRPRCIRCCCCGIGGGYGGANIVLVAGATGKNGCDHWHCRTCACTWPPLVNNNQPNG